MTHIVRSHEQNSPRSNSEIDKLRQNCNLMQRQLFELKEAHLKLEVQYAKLKQRYAEIYSKQQFKLLSNSNERMVKEFLNSQMAKATLKNHQIVHQKQLFNQEKYDQMRTKIKQLANNLENAKKTLGLKQLQIEKTQCKNKEIVDQYQRKCKQKDQTIKILFGKILILQKQQNDETGMQKYNREYSSNFANLESQTDQIISEQASTVITIKQVTQILLDQISLEYYQTFINSLLGKNDQPSLMNFKNNLAKIDFTRLKPYCRCLQLLLKYQEKIQFSPKEANEKEKWIIKSLQSLYYQYCSANNQKKHLIYLFRLSGVYYRVQNSINSLKSNISLKLLTKIKILLFIGYYDYQKLNQSQQAIRIDNQLNYVI